MKPSVVTLTVRPNSFSTVKLRSSSLFLFNCPLLVLVVHSTFPPSSCTADKPSPIKERTKPVIHEANIGFDRSVHSILIVLPNCTS